MGVSNITIFLMKVYRGFGIVKHQVSKYQDLMYFVHCDGGSNVLIINQKMSTRNFQSHREMRHNTYLRVINAIKAGVKSKRGIQVHSGLSWGSCSPVINNLLAQQIVVNQDLTTDKKGSKGRKARYFHFNQQKHLLMGMEIDAHQINSCITTLGGNWLGSCRSAFKEAISSANIASSITRAFVQATAKFDLEPEHIYCVSFSIPGAVDVENKIWQYCERVPGIKEVSFDSIAGKGVLPPQFYLQHNIHAQAYSVIPIAEIENKDYVFIHVGQGMAMSANMGGILYGHRGFAGEIGHIPYPYLRQEIDCLCGKKNCLEAVLCKQKILEYVRQHFSVAVNALGEITDDLIKQRVAEDYILPPLVYTATIVSNIFDPHRIFIEGSVLEPFFPFLKDVFEARLQDSAWLAGPSDISWCKSNQTDGCYGAVLHSNDKIINDFVGQIDLDH